MTDKITRYRLPYTTTKGMYDTGMGIIHRNKHSWIHRHERGLFEFLVEESELGYERHTGLRRIMIDDILDIIQHKLGEHEPGDNTYNNS